MLVERGTAPFFGRLLGDPARVHLVPGLPRVATALVERYGVAATPARRGYDVVQGTKHLLPVGVGAVRVLTAHDMLLLDRPQDFDPVKRRLLRRPYLASLRSADVVTAVSAATRDRVAAWVPAAAPRTHVVPLATSPALLTAEPVPTPELAGRRFALVVGDPSPRKNLPLVVDAWPQVRAQVPDAVLAIVGPDSWGQTRYGAQFAALAAEGALVRLTGIDDGRLRWCYEHASVALAPSLAEGFGLPAAEALALGTPVITSQDPALVEVVGDRGPHLPADRGDLWAAAIVEALVAERPPRVPAPGGRSWDDLAAEHVALARAAAGARR